MTYMRQTGDLDACPACGSGRIACVVGASLGLDFCMVCLKAWERVGAGEAYVVDGEMLPFDVPCDNCAFRGGSAERADPEAWRHLQQTLSLGGQFFCHKGVAFDPCGAAGGRAFEFPLVDKTVYLAGKRRHPYKHYDRDRMRMCRGYLNRFIGGVARERS